MSARNADVNVFSANLSNFVQIPSGPVILPITFTDLKTIFTSRWWIRDWVCRTRRL